MYYMLGGLCEKEDYAFSYLTVLKYLENKIDGKNTAEFFQKHNYKSIAIHGIGLRSNIGRLLCTDIMNSGVKVKYFIDKSYNLYPDGVLGIPVIGVNDLQKQDPVDIIVIAPIFRYNEIAEELLNAGVDVEKMISLSDIVFNV